MFSSPGPYNRGRMSAKPWQLRILDKSLKKKEKLIAINEKALMAGYNLV